MLLLRGEIKIPHLKKIWFLEQMLWMLFSKIFTKEVIVISDRLLKFVLL